MSYCHAYDGDTALECAVSHGNNLLENVLELLIPARLQQRHCSRH